MSYISPKLLSTQANSVILKNLVGELVAGLNVDKATISGRDASLVGWAAESCSIRAPMSPRGG
jgi:hypothetical protein